MQSAATAAAIDDAMIRDMGPRLFRFATRSVRSEAIAEELVQETWIAAMKSLPAFEGRSALSSWVFGILRRKIVDHFRRSRTEVPLFEGLTAGDAPPLDHRMDHETAAELVHAELSALPPLERQAVLLVDVRGLERDEVATSMDVTRNHLRVLLHRGRDRLRRKLVAAGHAMAA